VISTGYFFAPSRKSAFAGKYAVWVRFAHGASEAVAHGAAEAVAPGVA